MLEGIRETKNFGGLKVLNNVDFYVDNKEIVGIIRPNGAGKTTLFNVISGFYRPDFGKTLLLRCWRFNGCLIGVFVV